MSAYLHALWTHSDFLSCEFSELGDPDWIYRLDSTVDVSAGKAFGCNEEYSSTLVREERGDRDRERKRRQKECV